jgi:hypothetical protein
MDTEFMKRKLDDEEYQALLNVFDGQKVSFRKTSSQSMPFRVSFYFMNIYAISMMLVFYIVSNYLLEYINPQFLDHHYLDLLKSAPLYSFGSSGPSTWHFILELAFAL